METEKKEKKKKEKKEGILSVSFNGKFRVPKDEKLMGRTAELTDIALKNVKLDKEHHRWVFLFNRGKDGTLQVGKSKDDRKTKLLIMGAEGDPRGVLETAAQDWAKLEAIHERRLETCRFVAGEVTAYREAVRRTFLTLYNANALACKVEEREGGGLQIRADSEKARKILGLLFDREGKSDKFYLEIKDILKGWNTRFCCQVSRYVWSCWTGKDPEFKVAKGLLINSMLRELSRFHFLPIPFACGGNNKSIAYFDEHDIVLNWRSDRPPVRFVVDDLTGKMVGKDKKKPADSRLPIWHALKDGRWTINSMSLHFDPMENYNKQFKVRVSYMVPDKKELKLDDSRCMEVNFKAAGVQGKDVPDDEKAEYDTEKEQFINMLIREGHKPSPGLPVDKVKGRSVSAVDVVDWLGKINAMSAHAKKSQASCGSRTEYRRGEGFLTAGAAVAAVRHRLAERRENGVKTWNHLWTKRIVEQAKEWDCGRIQVFDVPKMEKKRTEEEVEEGSLRDKVGPMFGHPWNFSQFKLMLEYKAKAAGIKVTYTESPEITQIIPGKTGDVEEWKEEVA